MKAQRKELMKALEAVKPAAMSGGAVQELKHIWFDKKTATAFDGGLGIRVQFESDLECGVLATPLLSLLKSGAGDEVGLSNGGSTLDVTMGRAKARIPALEIDRSPWNFPDKAPKGSLSITMDDPLTDGLKKARMIKASKPTRVEHYGVVVFPTEDYIYLYTTDSRALVQIKVKAVGYEAIQKVVLPHAFADQLIAFKSGNDLAKLTFTADHIVADFAEARICSTLLDCSSIHDLPALVDSNVTGEEQKLALPASLKAALSRAEALAGADEAYCTLSVSKKELKLQFSSSLGDIEEKLELDKAAKPAKITVALDHLKKFAAVAETFAITESALVLWCGDSALFLVSSHGEVEEAADVDEDEEKLKRKRAKPRDEEEEDNEE